MIIYTVDQRKHIERKDLNANQKASSIAQGCQNGYAIVCSLLLFCVYFILLFFVYVVYTQERERDLRKV